MMQYSLRYPPVFDAIQYSKEKGVEKLIDFIQSKEIFGVEKVKTHFVREGVIIEFNGTSFYMEPGDWLVWDEANALNRKGFGEVRMSLWSDSSFRNEFSATR